MGTETETSMGLISFLSFGISVIAAVVAIDMYKLLRTGKFGSSWRILIIASVIFSLVQALRLAELFDWGGLRANHLSEIADLIFVMALAYAFYLQRRVFSQASRSTEAKTKEREAEEERDILLGTFEEPDDVSATEPRGEVSREDKWARLTGRYAANETPSAPVNPVPRTPLSRNKKR